MDKNVRAPMARSDVPRSWSFRFGRFNGFLSSSPGWRAVLLLLICLLTGCKTAQVTNQQEFAPGNATKPAVIFVSDFELGAQNIRHEDGILSGGPGPLDRVSKRLYGTSEDPQARARQLVSLMSDSLVKDLAKAGFTASRLAPNTPLPASGWLVRGIFTQVQEGNRLRRAMIGFGSGQTDLQVVTFIDDLSHGPPKPLYEVETEASSGKKAGAAPTLAIGPYGAAARFVMADKDLDKNVKQTASQLATQITQRIQQAKPASP